MGKSYIVAAIALIASITHKYSNITIVVPNSFLKSRDHTKFAALFTNHKNVQYTDSLQFEVQAKHLVLVDEADEILYKKPEQFFAIGAAKNKIANKAARPKIVCFTSTKGHDNELWHTLLKIQGYKELSYWP
jgi:hypothetical protein